MKPSSPANSFRGDAAREAATLCSGDCFTVTHDSMLANMFLFSANKLPDTSDPPALSSPVLCSYNAKRRHWRRTKLGI